MLLLELVVGVLAVAVLGVGVAEVEAVEVEVLQPLLLELALALVHFVALHGVEHLVVAVVDHVLRRLGLVVALDELDLLVLLGVLLRREGELFAVLLGRVVRLGAGRLLLIRLVETLEKVLVVVCQALEVELLFVNFLENDLLLFNLSRQIARLKERRLKALSAGGLQLIHESVDLLHLEGHLMLELQLGLEKVVV